MLSPKLLHILREYWRTTRQETGCSRATPLDDLSRRTPWRMPARRLAGFPVFASRSRPIRFDTMPRPGLCREGQNELAQGPRNAGLLAHQPVSRRHSPEAWDQSCLRKASNSSSG
jgi:hypothetical protein